MLLHIFRVIGDEGVDGTVDAGCGALQMHVAAFGTHVAEGAGRRGRRIPSNRAGVAGGRRILCFVGARRAVGAHEGVLK